MSRKLILVFMFLVLCSCNNGNLDKEYVLLMDQYLNVNIPKYKTYVSTDKSLDELQKKAIIDASDELLKMSSEKKEQVEKK